MAKLCSVLDIYIYENVSNYGNHKLHKHLTYLSYHAYYGLDWLVSPYDLHEYGLTGLH